MELVFSSVKVVAKKAFKAPAFPLSDDMESPSGVLSSPSLQGVLSLLLAYLQNALGFFFHILCQVFLIIFTQLLGETSQLFGQPLCSHDVNRMFSPLCLFPSSMLLALFLEGLSIHPSLFLSASFWM